MNIVHLDICKDTHTRAQSRRSSIWLWSTTWLHNYTPSRQRLSPYQVQSILKKSCHITGSNQFEYLPVQFFQRQNVSVGGISGLWQILHTWHIKMNMQVILQMLRTLRRGSNARCLSVTPWPLLAPLPNWSYTVGLLSPTQAWGQIFWEVRGRGMKWWCHCGCWRVARGIRGGLSRGSQWHTRLTVLCSQPVDTKWGTDLPLMALNSA